ncbi:MAG TPA: hypothetical protein VFN71_02475 [Methylomirabilota bacterium]|nr:hypothetical protein [Methylomirabilota bacterium]HEU5040047.1 hypothetical protein [Gemmatimonadales bacterium]
MDLSADRLAGIVQVGAFTVFVPRFEELIATTRRMQLFFIHSRRWRENHDAAIKAFLARPDSTLEIFLPDLENHELLYSLEKHFDDGPLIPALVADAYRYFGRLARETRRVEIWLFGRYPTYSFYGFDERAIIALYSNSTAKKELPAFEILRDGLLGRFLDEDIEDLKRECRKRAPEELVAVIGSSGTYQLGPNY